MKAEDLSHSMTGLIDNLNNAYSFAEQFLENVDERTISMITSDGTDTNLDDLSELIEWLQDYASVPEFLEMPSTREEVDQRTQEVLGTMVQSFSPISEYVGPVFNNYLSEAARLAHIVQDDLSIVVERSDTIFETPGIIEQVQPSIVIANTEILKRLGPDPRDWLSLGPRKFEELLAEIWEGLGWQTILTPPSRDGGFDIRAIRSEHGVLCCYLIEAKAYKPEHPVGVEIVRSFSGVIERERASHGIIATTSRFTKGAAAESCVFRYRLTLAGFDDVLRWLNQYRAIKGKH